MFQILLPGNRLPDTEFFFAQRDALIAKPLCVSDKQSGQALGVI
jgi:hypothetical protein